MYNICSDHGEESGITEGLASWQNQNTDDWATR